MLYVSISAFRVEKGREITISSRLNRKETQEEGGDLLKRLPKGNKYPKIIKLRARSSVGERFL
ncbi:MAG: hypothetical protein QME89_11295, partial [Actinomycetota bacterium]|nr:hypothetical protein [Actinomycetota bacterium]